MLITANDYGNDSTGSYSYKYCHKCHWWYTDEECPQCKRKENGCSKVYNEGWVCPKCGNVYAPHVTECIHCNSNVSPWTITWTGKDWDYPTTDEVKQTAQQSWTTLRYI